MTANHALSPHECRRISRAWSALHQAGNNYRACPQDENLPSTTVAREEYQRQVRAYLEVLDKLGVDKPVFERKERVAK